MNVPIPTGVVALAQSKKGTSMLGTQSVLGALMAAGSIEPRLGAVLMAATSIAHLISQGIADRGKPKHVDPKTGL